MIQERTDHSVHRMRGNDQSCRWRCQRGKVRRTVGELSQFQWRHWGRQVPPRYHGEVQTERWWIAGCRNLLLHCHKQFPLARMPLWWQQKSRLFIPFWYRLTWVVPDKGTLNLCSFIPFLPLLLFHIGLHILRGISYCLFTTALDNIFVVLKSYMAE